MTERICSLPDCDGVHYGRGFCNKHYKRWRKFGDPRIVRHVVGDNHARLASRTNTTGPIPQMRPDLGPCWLWTGVLDKDGYGQVHVAGSTTTAHRWAWILQVGPVPDGLELDHLCMVRNCVRISHLDVVTHDENMRRRAAAKE